jgi:preprotein translocase subunit Sss1
MDARVKPARDELAMQLKVVIAGLDPAIHPSS